MAIVSRRQNNNSSHKSIISGTEANLVVIFKNRHHQCRPRRTSRSRSGVASRPMANKLVTGTETKSLHSFCSFFLLCTFYTRCYGRPLSVSGRPCYILPMFLFIYFFYGRLILRPWLTEVRESFTRGGPWAALKKLLLGFFPGHP